MKLVPVCVLAMAVSAYAEDFDGTWKVPDVQTQHPAKCDGGDQKECLRLAWSAEAGMQTPGDSNVKRLEKARAWHAKACTIAKQKPCANAERVTKKLDAVTALKTDADRAQFWCADALEGAKRFAAGSGTAPVVVRTACVVLLPKGFKKGADAVIAAEDRDERSAMILIAAQEAICPTLKPRPVSCTNAKDPAKLSQPMREKMLGMILKAALPGRAAEHADELAVWLMK